METFPRKFWYVPFSLAKCLWAQRELQDHLTLTIYHIVSSGENSFV